MIRVAAVQMASGSNLKGNLLEAEKQIRDAVSDGAELIVLPENFGMIGAQQEDVLDYREQPGKGPLHGHGCEMTAARCARRALAREHVNRLRRHTFACLTGRRRGLSLPPPYTTSSGIMPDSKPQAAAGTATDDESAVTDGVVTKDTLIVARSGATVDGEGGTSVAGEAGCVDSLDGVASPLQ